MFYPSTDGADPQQRGQQGILHLILSTCSAVVLLCGLVHAQKNVVLLERVQRRQRRGSKNRSSSALETG